MPYAFSDIVEPLLPRAGVRPRRSGLTVVMDKGLGLGMTRDLVVTCGEYIDFWKLAFGTAGLYPAKVLAEKLQILRAAGVIAYPGGTFLELANAQGRAEAFVEHTRCQGFGAIEISDGALPMSAATRRFLIRFAREQGLSVLTEVGKKDDQKQPEMAELRDQALADLEAGAHRVIVEARESGRGIGIYDREGRILRDELSALAVGLPLDALIWEAPEKAQQAALIRIFGPEVNLGNVPPAEALALEAMRRGWRADTIPADHGTTAGDVAVPITEAFPDPVDPADDVVSAQAELAAPGLSAVGGGEE